MQRAVAASLIAVLISCAASCYVFLSMGKAWFWKRAIRRFENSDLSQPPQPGVIVFTGSSSINFWNSLIHDMAPLNVINRGFGGSQMAHVTKTSIYDHNCSWLLRYLCRWKAISDQNHPAVKTSDF